jgi:flagellin FlaB
MKTLLKDQGGMTGLETAIILIAFVTVAAVFGYAVLSAGLFSAERGKETIYSGLNEARSNMELCGSIMATSNDSANLSRVMFTVKNAIAGAPVDLAACNGTSSAVNKCVISFTTASDYFSNIKWTRQPVAHDNGNNLLEPGEQFEITVDLNDLGDNISLSENLTANGKFTLQVKPAIGASITIQRTLPPSIGAIMDLDLGTSFGGGTGGGSSAGIRLSRADDHMYAYSEDPFTFAREVNFYVQNTGTATIDMTQNYDAQLGLNTTIVSLTSEKGTYTNIPFDIISGDTLQLAPGDTCCIQIFVSYYRGDDLAADLNAGETFTITVTPQGGPTLTVTETMPNPLLGSMMF